MLLPFDNELVVTNHFDAECSMLADRHYSRRTVGARQFMYSGRKLVIRNREGSIVFGWHWPEPTMRMDGQTGYYCSIFRNESGERSSGVILRCEQMAFDKWGPNRMFTYVDPREIASRNPGYCFKCAGWKFERLSKRGLHLLVKLHPVIGLEEK